MHKQSWQALIQHQRQFSNSLPMLFAEDADRFQNFSIEACNILFDYSKQRIQKSTIDLLCALAEDSNLNQSRQALFSGEKINRSENQPALHSALRDSSQDPIWVDGKNVKLDIQTVLQRLETFSEDIRHHRLLGATGEAFSDVICLGIGGSELGPALLTQALQEYKNAQLQMHFISNVDGKTVTKILNHLDPQKTLCIISSKTFTTPETLQNAKIVKAWYEAAFKSETAVAKHLVAVTSAAALAINFGVSPCNIFEFWRWVGGRYSVWSAVGLPAILSMGMTNFKALLVGAEEMDQHFKTAPFSENMPVMMALLSIWNRNFWNFSAQAIIPYDDGLEKLPAYIQQLEMESNGKAVDQNGETLSYNTAPLIWGGVGCNGQHAFMQLLHQGTDIIPVDFLIGVQGEPGLTEHQALLLANCFAQSKALMEGQRLTTYNMQTIKDGSSQDNSTKDSPSAESLNQAKHCPGNRPSSTLIYPKLTPKVLGSLLALFEHKVFVQGVIWGINSFDQWGVELGKTLAKNILLQLDNGLDNRSSDKQMQAQEMNNKQMDNQLLDSSTTGLLQFVKKKNLKTQ
jgi:glucose-6-phosphate isomerase